MRVSVQHSHFVFFLSRLNHGLYIYIYRLVGVSQSEITEHDGLFYVYSCANRMLWMMDAQNARILERQDKKRRNVPCMGDKKGQPAAGFGTGTKIVESFPNMKQT